MQKTVKLISLTLQNFKGAKDTLVNFGEVTRISGANGTGKSTIFDAFTWVLFGKNAEDRTDSGKGGFQLKTVDGSGESLHNLEHRVTAVLEVNGNLSVLLKSSEQTVTAGDLNIDNEKAALPLPVISDGKIIKESLGALETSEEQIIKKVAANNTEVRQVFLMTMDRYGNFSLIKMRDKQ